MTDLGREMARSMRIDWDASRVQAGRLGLHARRRRRTIVRASAIATIGLAAIAWVMLPRGSAQSTSTAATANATPTAASPAEPTASTAVASLPVAPSTTAPPVAPPTTAPPVAPTAIPLSPDSRVTIVSDDPAVVALAAGAARFEVGARELRVIAGGVSIVALSAKFAASRSEQRVRVEVIEGSVRVRWDDRERELAAGQTASFPPERARRAKQPIVPSAIASWRDLARDGEFAKANAALVLPDAPPVRDVPDDLLLVADVKRLTHHAAEAVAPLRQILRDHVSDPRAPLAAFTLGRVLLDLDRAGEAAEAFAQADALAPDGPLAEDAIARQVEALARDGNTALAHQVAERYVSRFPDGRKLRSVRRFGRLE